MFLYVKMQRWGTESNLLKCYHFSTSSPIASKLLFSSTQTSCEAFLLHSNLSLNISLILCHSTVLLNSLDIFCFKRRSHTTHNKQLNSTAHNAPVNCKKPLCLHKITCTTVFSIQTSLDASSVQSPAALPCQSRWKGQCQWHHILFDDSNRIGMADYFTCHPKLVCIWKQRPID